MNEGDRAESQSPTETADTRFVAFCDILGFSNKILTNFEETLRVYREFGRRLSERTMDHVEITMYSDAILITSPHLGRVLAAVQMLWMTALFDDLMIRGAVTRGRYWQLRQGNSLLVASDALVRAVRLEKSVGFPAVVIADDIDIPDDWWLLRFRDGPLVTSILHFRDRNIVNPFSRYWFQSACTRASQLMKASPEHRDKYLWFLALHDAVNMDRELIPPDVFARFVRDGVLVWKKSDDKGQDPK
jgi:hypothetical protein